MSLITILSQSFNQYSDLDPKWRQFIDDHKTYLIEQSPLMSITPSYMQRYKYSIKQYLQSVQFNHNCAWIVQLINNIPSDIQFTGQNILLYIPPMNVIEALYTNYVTANPTT